MNGQLAPECRAKSALSRYFGAPLPYSDELAKKMIHALKYQHAKEIASPLSLILIEFLDKNGFGETATKYRMRACFAPVPLYDFRERERGFNQASEIGKYLSQYYKIPIEERLLIKHKNTEPQADIKNKEDREKNIAGAFVINKRGPRTTPTFGLRVRGRLTPDDFMQNKIVILVDDVYTSGSTMRECALVLRRAGAHEVWGMTVARG